MTVDFYLYCRVPVGKVLGSIVKACESLPISVPHRLLLTSRQRREDLAVDDVLRSAANSSSDSCDIVTDRGSIGAAWLYGPRNNVPRLWGTLRITDSEVEMLESLLNRLCRVAGCTYAVADLASVRTESMRSHPDTYEAKGVVSALHELYWYNYFGSEYRGELSLTEGVRGTATRITEFAQDAFSLITRPSPKAAVDPQRITAIATEWPVFRKYDRLAGFRTPVQIDYSQVWDLPAPVSNVGPIRDVVGPADEFIASIPTHAERFYEWARSKGLSPRSEKDFMQIFQQHEQIIRDELLVPAIAAYGEMVRGAIDGVWSKAGIFHRGEPVVTKSGRPWTARRVILEVLEGLEPIEF